MKVHLKKNIKKTQITVRLVAALPPPPRNYDLYSPPTNIVQYFENLYGIQNFDTVATQWFDIKQRRI